MLQAMAWPHEFRQASFSNATVRRAEVMRSVLRPRLHGDQTQAPPPWENAANKEIANTHVKAQQSMHEKLVVLFEM